QLHAGDQTAEVPIPVLRFTQDGYGDGQEGRERLDGQDGRTLYFPSCLSCPSCLSSPLRSCLSCLKIQRQFGANDRLGTSRAGGLVKRGCTVDAVSIEQRERRIAERCSTIHERFGQRSRLEKTECGRGVKLHVHGIGVIRRFGDLVI